MVVGSSEDVSLVISSTVEDTALKVLTVAGKLGLSRGKMAVSAAPETLTSATKASSARSVVVVVVCITAAA